MKKDKVEIEVLCRLGVEKKMKKETAFWREDHVRKALKALGSKLTVRAGELAIDNM